MTVSLRSIFRLALTGLLFLVGVIAVVTVETAADEVGYTSAVRSILNNGVSAFKGWSYSDAALLLFAVLLGAVAALWIDYFIRKATTITFPKTNRISETKRGQVFRNQEVLLDGIRYEQCEFHNVTFKYNGGIVAFTNNQIFGCVIASDVPELNGLAHLLHQFGFLRVPMMDEQGDVPMGNRHVPPEQAE